MTFAQTVGVKAGLNLSNVLMKDNATTYSSDYKMNPGFNVGVMVDFPMGGVFSIEPGFLISTKGYKDEYKYDDHPNGTVTIKHKTNSYYLDIPVNAKASFNTGDVKIYGLFGPYLGIGLTGKTTVENTDNTGTNKEEKNIDWGTDPDTDLLKRFDFGLTFGAGGEYRSVFLEVTYGLGLVNISSNAEDGFKINNRVLGVSVGYRFGGK
jgi:hypothetical protein